MFEASGLLHVQSVSFQMRLEIKLDHDVVRLMSIITQFNMNVSQLNKTIR